MWLGNEKKGQNAHYTILLLQHFSPGLTVFECTRVCVAFSLLRSREQSTAAVHSATALLTGNALPPSSMPACPVIDDVMLDVTSHAPAAGPATRRPPVRG